MEIDCLDRANGFAGPAVDALLRMNIEGTFPFVDAVHGTGLDTCAVQDIYAGKGNDVRQSGSPLDPRVDGFAPGEELQRRVSLFAEGVCGRILDPPEGDV